MSFTVDFDDSEAQHRVQLEPTTRHSEKAVSIHGIDYKILGTDEDISLLKSHITRLDNCEFESVKSFEASLKKIGDQSKIDPVFQKTLIAETPKLTKRTSAAEKFLDELEKKDEFSGIVLVQQGKARVIKAVLPTGLDQLDKTGFNENTPFNIASVGKWFTAVAILQLVSQNKVKLDDPVSKYLELEDYKLIGAHQEYRDGLPHSNVGMLKLIHEIKSSGITIRELLTMTSGLKDGDPLAEHPTVHFLDRSESSREHGYSNYGYQLLARVVQNMSEMGFSDYVKEQIFLKSGMSPEHADRAVSAERPQNAPAAQFGNEIPAQLKKDHPLEFEADKMQRGYFSLPNRVIPSTDGNGCYWMSAIDLLALSKSIIETEDILNSTMKKQSKRRLEYR